MAPPSLLREWQARLTAALSEIALGMAEALVCERATLERLDPRPLVFLVTKTARRGSVERKGFPRY
jgi:hypothetical protein